MKHRIAFQKNFVITPNVKESNNNMAMIVQAELMQFGYMLDFKAFGQLRAASKEDIQQFYTEVIYYLKEHTGGLRNYEPIYKGFPQQTMEMSEFSLWLNQIIGYLSGGSFTPNEWTKTKGTAFEYVNYKMITEGTKEDFNNIFTSLVGVNQSLTPSDVEIIKWFINNHPDLIFPQIIPFKENLGIIFGEALKIERGLDTMVLPKLTTTDILRIIVHLSGGDTALPKVPKKIISIGYFKKRTKVENPERQAFKFKKFSRPERKYLLGLLEKSNLDVREMKLKDQRWVRIGEILHPGEYRLLFPKTNNAFNELRSTKVKSWYGEVEAAFKVSYEEGLKTLSSRPGEFLRKLDNLVRKASSTEVNKILYTLSTVGKTASNKVLFEVYTHFENRKFAKNRYVSVKGKRTRVHLPSLPPLDPFVIDLFQSTILNIVKEKLKNLPTLGNCWIDPELKKIPLPTNMRSVNDSLVPIIRGERIPIFDPNDAKTIRCFIHWFDEKGDLDIDLHGLLIGETKSIDSNGLLIREPKFVSFGYNGLLKDDLGCYSGDVRHREGACAEYVDINIAKALKQGFDYFLMIAHNFQSGKLSDIKECVVGTMLREFPESNDTWLPNTIINSMKVNGAGNMTLVAAVDLKSGEYIPLDLDVSQNYVYFTNSEIEKIKQISFSYLELPKLSVYDLLSWHVEARGNLVSKELAETQFSFKDFSSSYISILDYMGI